MLSVRRAVSDDVERLAEVHVRCWQETYRGMLSEACLASVDPAGRLTLWHHLLDQPEPSEVWAASDDGTVVGFAGIHRKPAPGSPQGHPPPSSGDLELWGLYLLDSHQGRGLGHRLLEAALGNSAASLWVAGKNTGAIRFYERFGFVPDGAEDVVAEWENLPIIRMVRPEQPGN